MFPLPKQNLERFFTLSCEHFGKECFSLNYFFAGNALVCVLVVPCLDGALNTIGQANRQDSHLPSPVQLRPPQGVMTVAKVLSNCAVLRES